MKMSSALAKQLQMQQQPATKAAMLVYCQHNSVHRKNNNYNSKCSNSSTSNSNSNNYKQQNIAHSREHLTASICKDGLRRQNANCSHFNLTNNGLRQQTGVTQSSTTAAANANANATAARPTASTFATLRQLFAMLLLRSSNNNAKALHCARRKPTKFRPLDVLAIVPLMLAVTAIMISEHAVSAAQRESLKDKDPFAVNVNANTIPNRYNIVNSNHNNNNNNNINAVHGSGNQTHGLATSERKKFNIEDITTRSTKNVDGYGTSTTNEQTETTGTLQKATLANGPSTMSTPLTKYGTITPSQASSSFKKLSVNSVTSGGQRNSIELTDEARNGPYFDKTASKNVTALLGKTAYLNCRVKNLGNKTMLLQVSWVRHRDIHLLTVGRYTYTSDQRFRALHLPQSDDWTLQIKYPQHRDSGIYECQVSTTPHMSHYIHLNVVEPSTEIVGAPDLYIENGSTINLTCVIFNSPEPPAYIYWNHNDAIINYDSPRGGVSVVTIKGETTTSFLLIKSARPSDSGLYQCNPSNARPKMVTVHVLNGVSHSVSRGIPSSNAARGTSVSSHVTKSLSTSLFVNIFVYLSVCRTLYTTARSSRRYSYEHALSHYQQLIALLCCIRHGLAHLCHWPSAFVHTLKSKWKALLATKHSNILFKFKSPAIAAQHNALTQPTQQQQDKRISNKSTHINRITHEPCYSTHYKSHMR